MLKLLLAVVIFWLLYRFSSQGIKKSFTPRPQNFKNPAATIGSIETLLACPKCGIFFRRDQGVKANGQWFCNKGCK